MVNPKKTPTNPHSVWFKDPSLPTTDELVAYAKELDAKYPGDTMSRNYLRAKLQNEIGITDPWEKLPMNWGAFKELCGFATTAAARKLINAGSKHARVDHLRTASEERLSWGDIYTRPENGERYKVVMGVSDLHDVECDPFAYRMFIEKLHAVKPDVLVINGDLFDAPEFSKHFDDPREWDMIGRMHKAHDMMGEMREVVGTNCQFDFIEGNHEARIARHTVENNAGLATLLASEFHDMGIRELLCLDRYDINYIAKGDLFAFTDAQLKKEVLESERLYWNSLWVRHHPPKQVSVTCAGFHGHHHAHNVTTYMNPIFGSFEWHQTGGMHKRNASYTDGRRWNLGFITAHIDTQMQRTVFDYTYVGDTCCQMGGKFYERRVDEFYPSLRADLDNRLNNAKNSPAVSKLIR